MPPEGFFTTQDMFGTEILYKSVIIYFEPRIDRMTTGVVYATAPGCILLKSLELDLDDVTIRVIDGALELSSTGKEDAYVLNQNLLFGLDNPIHRKLFEIILSLPD
jgi:hypothetical protein